MPRSRRAVNIEVTTAGKESVEAKAEAKLESAAHKMRYHPIGGEHNESREHESR
jgi:hypothetical protein